MIELLVLIAIAYAGARGVESITGTSDRRHDTTEANKTVAKVAASGPKDSGVKKPPGPVEPGGTFSAAAPRSAKAGASAAVPFAVLTETGSTMWKTVGEGYRQRWPEIRAEHRQKMAAKAAARKAEREQAEAQRKADEALAKAGPPPAIPPKPSDPPASEPRSPGAQRPAGVGKAPDDERTAPAAGPESSDGRRHLTVVPDDDPAQNGESMSQPMSVIPEIRTLDGLMNALTITKAMCEMRSEEALAISADDKALSDRLDQLETELGELEVDAKTIGEINGLRESIHAQSQAAAQYGSAAKDSGDFAVAAAQAAFKAHGGIAEAVQSSPIEKAAQAGYYER